MASQKWATSIFKFSIASKCWEQNNNWKARLLVSPEARDHWVDFCNSTRDLTAKWGSGDNFSVHPKIPQMSEQLSQEWCKGKFSLLGDNCRRILINPNPTTFKHDQGQLLCCSLKTSTIQSKYAWAIKVCVILVPKWSYNFFPLYITLNLFEIGHQANPLKLWVLPVSFCLFSTCWLMRGTLVKVFGI